MSDLSQMPTATVEQQDRFRKAALEIEEMLYLAWDAVTEADYEGYSHELREFMGSKST